MLFLSTILFLFSILKESIRAYQMERFRYYYAVTVCDTAETANALYEACDGYEYETSGVALDLRFIADDMKFDVRFFFCYSAGRKQKSSSLQASRLRDACEPQRVDLQKYKPKRFLTTLVNSSSTLDWDEDDFHRREKILHAFDENADDNELKFASSDRRQFAFRLLLLSAA